MNALHLLFNLMTQKQANLVQDMKVRGGTTDGGRTMEICEQFFEDSKVQNGILKH